MMSMVEDFVYSIQLKRFNHQTSCFLEDSYQNPSHQPLIFQQKGHLKGHRVIFFKHNLGFLANLIREQNQLDEAYLHLRGNQENLNRLKYLLLF